MMYAELKMLTNKQIKRLNKILARAYPLQIALLYYWEIVIFSLFYLLKKMLLLNIFEVINAIKYFNAK